MGEATDGDLNRRLEADKQRLELERDVARLRAEISGIDVPWWRRGAVVSGLLAGVTTIVSAAATGIAAINGHYQV